MNKPASLRAFLEAYVPELKRNPDKLKVSINSGGLGLRYSPSNLGYEYSFELNVTVLEYSGHPDEIFLPLSLWIRQNQAEILMNPDLAKRAVSFDVDFLDATACDIGITLDLTEAVDVIKKDDGSGYELRHREEPAIAGTELLIDPAPLLQRIYRSDGGLVVGTPEA